MSTKIDELLAVLDMPKDELDAWLKTTFMVGIARNELPHYMSISSTSVNLTDLAFRLRDELVLATPHSERYAFGNALEIVYEHERENGTEGTNKAGWGRDFAQPIHWVIASLIAKEFQALKGD